MTRDLSNPIGPAPRSPDEDAPRQGGACSGVTRDDALLDRVRSKDQSAMTEIFDRYGSMVYSIALRVLRDSASAEDIMQEIFFQVWENPRSFISGRGSLGGWLSVITRNRAVDVLRRRRPADPVDEVVLAATTNLAVEAERHIIMKKLRVRLESLPPDQQRLVDLAFFEGLSHSEIAAQTGIPLGTVKTRIRSALISLREAIQV